MSGADIGKEEDRQTRRLTTIVVADICGYSSLSEKDQNAAIKLSDMLYKIFEITTKQHGGRVFNRLGDGFLAEFPSARSGMEAALGFCREVNARNNLAPNSINARVRAGIHVGDVVDRSDGDILGHGVNIAARLQDQAAPGTILASSNIINLLGPTYPHKGQKRSGLNLKNIDEAITAYQIDPDKSHKGINLRVPKWLRSKGLMYTVLAGVVLYSAITIQEQRHAELLDQKIDLVMQQNFDTGGSKSNNNVSAPYIRNVLENLHRSNIPSHQASFALLEEGHIGLAIERLEKSLDAIEFGSADYVETMHQIAALSQHYDPQKSASYYETILEINPNDEATLDQILYIYNLTSRPELAATLYLKYKDRQNHTETQRLRTIMDMAFNQNMTGNYETANSLLIGIEETIEKPGLEREKSRWLTESAILNERLDKLEKAEAQLLSSIMIQSQIGKDANYSRSENVLGMIYLKRSDMDITNRAKWLEKSESHFLSQLEHEKFIHKKNGQIEAQFYLGIISTKTGEYAIARQRFLEGIRLAKEHKSFNMEFAILVQLSNLEIVKNSGQECRYIKKAHKVFKQHIKSNIGPRTVDLIEKTNCGISFL